MSKARDLLNLLENNSSAKDDRSELEKFLSSGDAEQDVAIEKFRKNKQLRYMKKYQNNRTNDKPVGTADNRAYYWDSNVTRVYGN